MARFELSVSPTYVKHWTIVEAVREIFQNAIDQQTIDPENVMAHDYDPINETLSIYSMRSMLDRSSLLFGNTTKAENSSLIGSFGEGYKLALLVLVRDNYDVEIHNYACNELWVPKIVKSRRYNSDILVVDIKKWRLSSAPDNDLTFVIKGVSQKDYDDICDSILFLQDDVKSIDTIRGSVLLGDEHAGKIFVEGLFVNKLKGKMIYGYDIKSEHVVLDRDRKSLDAFQLTWETSVIWSLLASEHADKITSMLEDSAMDTQYFSNTSLSDSADHIYREFIKKNGASCTLVSTQSEYDRIKERYPNVRIVIASDNLVGAVQNSKYLRQYIMDQEEVTTKLTPTQVLKSFFDKYENDLSSEAVSDFEDILEMSEGWR